ncbi:MAG: ABC transporter ATP-binding protein [Candidatus Buchananbacteria bacterium CG10_big_fil_rev_8_21_14_0_10_42_9]|uniref:ABC transporter ATP-binding protein n=1 Tax=Candidatus Buchananbacteria bacterium CG10_big_fil_rev_8_21_14_0_10_42_9 TaxID=1974526 RepID=A0A2H0W0N4_9BACT|nr:MAG: ABC transporter ATP-binding protein [Candidatus Buchananbacteria bacterium CG10_big_fil_rev_8_21_14_0_10_42_9]
MYKETLLQLKDISVNYGGVKALQEVNVEIDEGEIVALMGPNGAGKSTILKSIFGLAPISSGKIFWHERKIKPVSHKIVQMGIAFVPQGRRVFTHLTVAENLEMGGFVVKDKKLLKQRMAEVMDIFPDLKKKLKSKSGTLSGGQQQMLALARGLMVDPKVLLLDEPSLGLSPKLVKEVFAKIKEINQRRKTAIMVVEHNIKSLLEITSRAYLLDKGKIVAHDTAQTLAHSDILEKVFMGKLK